MALLVDSVSEEGRGAAMGTFTASFDLGIGMGSIILGFVLQYFNFSGDVYDQRYDSSCRRGFY